MFKVSNSKGNILTVYAVHKHEDYTGTEFLFCVNGVWFWDDIEKYMPVE